jgi:flagellum-specific ATP synthase
MTAPWDALHAKLRTVETAPVLGLVTGVVGLLIKSRGPQVAVGDLCELLPPRGGEPLLAEVVGFQGGEVLLMPLGELQGLAPGWRVRSTRRRLGVHVGPELLGRVIDGLGRPLDGAPLPPGLHWMPAEGSAPHPLSRQLIREPLSVGVRVLDGLLTVGKGQRLGIFAGSGVGKSTLLGMMARNTVADVNVIALIGERGREVREFLENDLGPAGLARSVVVVATSDQPPLVRIKGALLATAVAEYFRDQGRQVLLMMDSVTRLAMAQREVGLAVGEPPATRGYTPSVFALLPRVLERSGAGETGAITGIYTVLVDGDDVNEPISDTVRGILDGHVVLSRRLASQNHYPAVDVLQSVSRVMPALATSAQMRAAGRLRSLLATYREAEDLVNIGAYQRGSNPLIDQALEQMPAINAFLRQGTHEPSDLSTAVAALQAMFGGDDA